jgi:hypothetical protein
MSHMPSKLSARVVVQWECGHEAGAWSDDLQPCPHCGMSAIMTIAFPIRGPIVRREPHEAGALCTFEDGSQAVVSALPRDVQ